MYPTGGWAAPSVAYRAYAKPFGRSLITAADQSELAAVGFTHASTVIPLVSRNNALSATVTQAFVPLKESALPYLPDVVQAALESVPVSKLPDTSAVVVPVPSSNPHAPTSPVELLTVTETTDEVVVFPAASRARAVKLCEPFDVDVVAQETE